MERYRKSDGLRVTKICELTVYSLRKLRIENFVFCAVIHIRVKSSGMWVSRSNLRVTSWNPWVTNSNSWVTSSNPPVMSLSTWVPSSKARVARLKVRAEILKAWVEAINFNWVTKNFNYFYFPFILLLSDYWT